MKKDFDFDDIGKQTPYRVPEGFFAEMQQKVLKQAGVKPHPKFSRKLIVPFVAAAAAILAGFLFIPSLMQTDATVSSSDVLAVENNHITADPMDEWIRNLSDEELEDLVGFSENDIFLN